MQNYCYGEFLSIKSEDKWRRMTIQIYSILRLSVSNYDLGLREDDHFHYCYMPVKDSKFIYRLICGWWEWSII